MDIVKTKGLHNIKLLGGIAMKKLVALLFSCALVFALPVNVFAKGADKNCSDFATQEEAQKYFVSHGGSKYNNVDGLDRDHDGIACESLPHGGSSSSGGTKHSSSHHSTSGSHTSTSHHSSSSTHKVVNTVPQPATSNHNNTSSNNTGNTNTSTTTSKTTNTSNNTTSTAGGKLPKTATNYPTALLISASLMLAGVGILTVKPLIGKM